MSNELHERVDRPLFPNRNDGDWGLFDGVECKVGEERAMLHDMLKVHLLIPAPSAGKADLEVPGMSFPILVETREGRFTASLVGVPDLIAVESTRSQAIAALRKQIRRLIELGELLTLEVEDTGISSLAGKYSDDETLPEICAEIYRQRDADRDA